MCVCVYKYGYMYVTSKEKHLVEYVSNQSGGFTGVTYVAAFICFWLRWVFVAACGISLVPRMGAALGWGVRASPCGGFSCCGAQALGLWASGAVAHGLGYSWTCELFPDQGLNP